MDIVNKLTKDYLSSNNKNYEHEKNEFNLDYVRQKFLKICQKNRKKTLKKLNLILKNIKSV